MKRTWMLFCLSSLLVVGVGWAAESTAVAADEPSLEELLAPEPALKASCYGCATGYTTSPGGGQASHWGLGSSCALAQSSLTSQTRSAATAICADFDDYGICSFGVVVTAPCWWSSTYNQYVVDGYANFGCRYYTGGSGCPAIP